MGGGHEIELKLETDAGAGDRLRKHPLLSGCETKSGRQVSTYFDTEDGALRAAGFSLRVRQAGKRFIQTVKHQDAGSAGLYDRPEWEQEIESAEVDFAAVEQTPLSGVLTKKLRKRLAPVIRSEVKRTVWNLERSDGTVELTLDEGDISGGKSSDHVAEIEAELKQGEPAALFEVARALSSDVPMRIGVLTKAERGYALVDGTAGKAAKAERIVLDKGMTAAQGFAAIAHACLRHFRLNERLVTEKRDPIALHQARVAMRRLRSAFSLFRPVIADREFERLREELRWFTNQLGDARNLDVLLKRLQGKDSDAAAEALRRVLEERREQAYAGVIEALASVRLRRLMLDLVAWIEIGEWRSANAAAARPMEKFAVKQLDKRWRKVKAGGRALAELDPEPRHQLRIQIKKLRYAVEFLASLQAGDEAAAARKAFLSALEEMQEQLGELNDVQTAHELLGDLLKGRKDAEPMLRYARRRIPELKADKAQIQAAEEAYRQLAAVGPFWR